MSNAAQEAAGFIMFFGIGNNRRGKKSKTNSMTPEELLSRMEEAQSKSKQELSEKLSALSASVNRHDLAIADLLDSWEELQEKSRDEALLRETELYEQARSQLRHSEESEKRLLNLAIACFDQLFWFRSILAQSENETWSRQLALAEERLSNDRLNTQLELVDKTLVPVNYELHEIIGIVETEREEFVSRVAEVCSCGYRYQGRIIRKAKVTVFQLSAAAAMK